MDIIDFHTHIFPDHMAAKAMEILQQNAPETIAHGDGTLAGLRRAMAQGGISRSVLQPIATRPEQVTTINRSCAGLIAEDIVPFGTLHPLTMDFEAQLDQLQSLGVKGVKFHPEYQDFFIDELRYFPMYEALQDRDYIVLFHAGKDPGPFSSDHALPPAFKALVSNFPRLRIVAAHLGGWQVWDEVERYLLGLPIYLDTAAVREFLSPTDFVRMVRKHGAERIVFGSDSPWYDPGEDVAWIESLPLKAAEKERILGQNAAELLK
jgi:predicted TIM-barrel fold metal-dependent hydrolase